MDRWLHILGQELHHLLPPRAVREHSQEFGTTDCVHEPRGSFRLTNDSESMSQKTSAFEPSDRRLERHAADSIGEDTDLLTVVRKFDLSTTEVYKAGEINSTIQLLISGKQNRGDY